MKVMKMLHYIMLIAVLSLLFPNEYEYLLIVLSLNSYWHVQNNVLFLRIKSY